MIETEIKDRIPTHAGRVELIPVEGMTNHFTLKRADEPTEEGTPINKATLETVIRSRLTGRYYEPTVTREIITGQAGLTTSPIPTSGWMYDTDNRLIARSGSYISEASSDLNTSANRTADVFTNSGWESQGGLESWIEVYHTQALKVDKIRFTVSLQYSSRFTKMEIQGSTNGSTWQALGTYTSVTEDIAMDYTLVNTADYNYYRVVFTSSESNRVTVSNLAYVLYGVSSYVNSYELDKMPLEWTRGQRLMINTPANVNTYAVTENFLNGVKVNTILQSGKRYELRYNGSAFDVKEV